MGPGSTAIHIKRPFWVLVLDLLFQQRRLHCMWKTCHVGHPLVCRSCPGPLLMHRSRATTICQEVPQMVEELHQTDVEMHPVLSLSMTPLWHESSNFKVTKAIFGGPCGFIHMAPLQVPASGPQGIRSRLECKTH